MIKINLIAKVEGINQIIHSYTSDGILNILRTSVDGILYRVTKHEMFEIFKTQDIYVERVNDKLEQ